MQLAQLEEHLLSLFDPEKLARFPREHGFTLRGKQEIRKIGCATNLNLETAGQAIKENVDLLITHHDAWDFLFGMKEACVQLLAPHGISHYFVHAPLDDADFGTNVSLIDKIGAGIVEKSHIYEEVFYAGRVGEFENPLSFERLVERLEGILEEPVSAWRHNNKPVKRLCVVTGGGMMTADVKEAVERGCDTYITGEKVLYTLEYARLAGINLIIGSHTFTEIFGVESLAQIIKDKFKDTIVCRLKEEHREAGGVLG